MRAPTKPVFARELAPGPLRETLLALIDVRALLPLVHCTAASGCCPCSTASARPSCASRSRRPRWWLERPDVGAAAAAADHRHPRLRQATRPSAGAARRRARLQARRPAARRRGGQGHGRRARWPSDEDRRAAQARPAGGRRRRGRVARDARGDRGEPRGHDRRPRHRVPARPEGLGAALARGAARAEARVPPGRARPLPRASSGGCNRSAGDARDLDVHVLEFDACERSCPRTCATTSSRCSACCGRGGLRAPGPGPRPSLRADDDAPVSLGGRS